MATYKEIAARLIAEGEGIAEVWRPVAGYEGLYEVSNHGRVRTVAHSYERVVKGVAFSIPVRARHLKTRLRRYAPTGKPITTLVTLHKIGVGNKTFRVHRLVLEAFIGPCPDGMEGCHNDGNSENNNINNLRWDTRHANREDMKSHGTGVNPPKHCGEMHHNSKLSDDEVEKIRGTPYYMGMFKHLAQAYAMHPESLSRIFHGKSR